MIFSAVAATSDPDWALVSVVAADSDSEEEKEGLVPRVSLDYFYMSKEDDQGKKIQYWWR